MWVFYCLVGLEGCVGVVGVCRRRGYGKEGWLLWCLWIVVGFEWGVVVVELLGYVAVYVRCVEGVGFLWGVVCFVWVVIILRGCGLGYGWCDWWVLWIGIG